MNLLKRQIGAIQGLTPCSLGRTISVVVVCLFTIAFACKSDKSVFPVWTGSGGVVPGSTPAPDGFNISPLHAQVIANYYFGLRKNVWHIYADDTYYYVVDGFIRSSESRAVQNGLHVNGRTGEFRHPADKREESWPFSSPSVPKEARWAGGVDGGSFVMCDRASRDPWGPVFRCVIFNDYTGGVEARGLFVVAEKEGAKFKRVDRHDGPPKYSWYDGTKINLDGGSLTMVPHGEIDYPFGDGSGKKVVYEYGIVTSPEVQYQSEE